MKNILFLAGLLFSTIAQAAYMPNALSTGAKNWRVESARINFSSVCGLDLQSSSWLSSATNPNVGVCTFTMSGWSALPNCTMTVYSSTGIIPLAYISALSSTSITTQVEDQTGAAHNYAFHIVCIGPR